MSPIFFDNQTDFRAWLQKNYEKQTELLVGFYKINSGLNSLTWSQSVDEALCFGWIDGIRKSINNTSYQVRFTPRKANSIWSAVNIGKFNTLTKQGLMQPAGIKSFEKRTEVNSKIYSYENEDKQFSTDMERQFRLNKKAWMYFLNLAPGYKKASIFWVLAAKQQNTQQKRLLQLIADSELQTNKWKNNKYQKKI